MTPEEEFVNRLMKAISEDEEEHCEIDLGEGSEINDSLMICIDDCWYEVSDIVFPNLQRDITRIQLLTCIYNLPDIREKKAIPREVYWDDDVQAWTVEIATPVLRVGRHHTKGA